MGANYEIEIPDTVNNNGNARCRAGFGCRNHGPIRAARRSPVFYANRNLAQNLIQNVTLPNKDWQKE